MDDRGAGRIPTPRPHFRCSYGLTVNLSKSLCFVHRRNRRTSIFITLLIRREFCIVSDPLVPSSREIEKTKIFFRRPCRHTRGSAHSIKRTAQQALSNDKERKRVRQELPRILSRPPGIRSSAGCSSRRILYDQPLQWFVLPAFAFIPLSPSLGCHHTAFQPRIAPRTHPIQATWASHVDRLSFVVCVQYIIANPFSRKDLYLNAAPGGPPPGRSEQRSSRQSPAGSRRAVRRWAFPPRPVYALLTDR